MLLFSFREEMNGISWEFLKTFCPLKTQDLSKRKLICKTEQTKMFWSEISLGLQKNFPLKEQRTAPVSSQTTKVL